MNVELRLINRSYDVNNSQVVIFQKNVATSFDEVAIAWRVVKNLGYQDCHPFTYPMEFAVGVEDAWGNFTPHYPATVSQQWRMIRDETGDVLRLASSATTDPEEVEICNDLDSGAIHANVYRAGKLVAWKTNITPDQKAVFRFKPTIFIGVVSEVEEGEAIDAAIVSCINTELNLLGLRSADIIMTGGGMGPSATRFKFNLANVNKMKR